MRIDLFESYEGDLLIDGSDLSDTSQYPNRSDHQTVRAILENRPGGYKIYPTLGIDLGMYLGAPNSERTAKSIVVAMKKAITNASLIWAYQLDFDAIPVSKDTMAINVMLPGDEDNGTTVLFDTSRGYARSMITDNESDYGTVVKIDREPIKLNYTERI